ncbi:unnamed protein product [Dracunculus medinensis]|uniref:Amiloride-sensitive sodium channel n=1 Tax=Dracunculus medinensis TaxID=318479 RepID=A0A158Q3J3_DRAME|nr:unnamed protein product [Dracunculus medinensis]
MIKFFRMESLDPSRLQSVYINRRNKSSTPHIYSAVRRHKSLIEKIRIFAENTSAHGVRRVFVAQHAYAARLWLTGILFCFIILLIQAHHLFMKFNRYEKITNIELKFDQMEFPAITFCNLNPYKKSLVRLVPSVRDTMDVYENAKSFNKESDKRKESKVSKKQKLIETETEIKKLFEKFSEEVESYSQNYEDFDNNFKRFQRERYELVEAHCKCVGASSMECLRFQSFPVPEDAVCLCIYDRNSKTAWPCFNITYVFSFINIFCHFDHFSFLHSGKKITTREKIRKLWKPISTTTPTTTTTTTTTIPPTTTRHKNQSARVTAPETVKAMGFTGLTDGVAMLTRAKENLIFTMSALSKKQRIALSHQKNEFIEMCSFNGKQCDIDNDFKLHVDPEFGNCYTFNWNKSNIFMSSKAGSMYGIRVLLFVNTTDYMSTSESAGVRLAVHNPTEFPFPDTFGYSAPVGFASSFGLKKQVIKRLSAPYGECENNDELSSTKYIYGGYDYDPEGCHRSCFQNMLLNKCGCGDPRFPVLKGQKHCSAFNATARNCVETAIAEMGDFHHIIDNLGDCVCKQSCDHEVYSVTFSASRWPSGATDLGFCEEMSKEECEIFYGKNGAMVEVYYEQLNYELIRESEAYGVSFSVITIIECAVLFLDLLSACCNQVKKNGLANSLQSNRESRINRVNQAIININGSNQINEDCDEDQSNQKTFHI